MPEREGGGVGSWELTKIVVRCPSGARTRPGSARCWRRWPTRRSPARAWSTSRSTTASARWCTSRPGKSGPEVRIWSRLGNEKTAQFPAVVRALEPLARSLDAPLLDRRRDRRARRRRPAGRIPAAAGAHPPHRRARRRAARPGAAGRVHRVRSAARRRRGHPRPAAHGAAHALERRLRRRARGHAAAERAGGRRRPRAARARAGGGLGRADRQGGRVAVSVGPPQPGLAQAQARQRRGVRRRRLDRAAPHAIVLRRAAARRLRRRAGRRGR